MTVYTYRSGVQPHACPAEGGGSSPEMNAIATYLHDRCAVKQYQISYEHGGWSDNFAWHIDAKLALTFNTGSYMKDRK